MLVYILQEDTKLCPRPCHGKSAFLVMSRKRDRAKLSEIEPRSFETPKQTRPDLGLNFSHIVYVVLFFFL